MTKKTLAEVMTNNSFMPFYKADKEGLREEWYKRFRREYRMLVKLEEQITSEDIKGVETYAKK